MITIVLTYLFRVGMVHSYSADIPVYHGILEYVGSIAIVLTYLFRLGRVHSYSADIRIYL